LWHWSHITCGSLLTKIKAARAPRLGVASCGWVWLGVIGDDGVDHRKLPRERGGPKTRTGSVDPRKLPRDREHTDSFFIDSN